MLGQEASAVERRENIANADSVTLTIYCLDAAVKTLAEAKQYHVVGSMDEASAKIRKVQDVITELLLGLDYDQGGEIARNLGKLYNFMIRSLIEIHAGQDPAVFDQIGGLLSRLKSTWEELRMMAGARQQSHMSSGMYQQPMQY